MKTISDRWKIRELIDLREDNDLRVNPEYQRGAVWSESQMRLLIDSVLRGYQIPLIYLRKIERSSARTSATYYDIIDGQQRINALRSFKHGVVIDENRAGDRGGRNFSPLYDPQDEEDKKMFPYALQDSLCPWAGKTYSELGEIKDKFLDTEVFVAVMECDDNEARDLFIRLQGGSDLKPQEIRDAWPGKFCELVLELGGKPQMNKPGHGFFLKAMKARPAGDRGRSRQLAAQLIMLFLEQKEKGEDFFVSIKSSVLNGYYRQQVGLNINSPEVERFRKILDKLEWIFGDGTRPPLKGHDAIHLILFVDKLMDRYTRDWESGIAGAFDRFSAETKRAKEFDEHPDKESKEFQDIWTYDWKTRTSSDYPTTIKQRHEIYERIMLMYLGDKAKEKDSQRGFNSSQKATIYYRDKKMCHKCSEEITWENAEFHHIRPHSEGGKTTVENGTLVCSDCHREIHKNRN